MMKSDEERPGEGVDGVLSTGEHAQRPAQGPAQDASEAIPEEDSVEAEADAFEGLAPDLRSAIEGRGFGGLTAVQERHVHLLGWRCSILEACWRRRRWRRRR